MRASTLFALTAAVLLGLGSAVAVKYAGLFNRPPEPTPPPKVEIPVLVAARNLFAGDLIDASYVTVRNLRADELKDYEKNKDQYLPSLPAAAALRVAAKNIEADRPLRRDLLQDLSKPESLSTRLLPQMRAVNLSVQKDHSAGGLIQVGEWVDVLFTSTIEGVEPSSATTRTACIAHRLRVITKRNGLWNVFAPLPEDKPVTFTLEANPYRVALIEYCKSKGNLSLSPVSAAEQKDLEERRAMALNNTIKPVSYAPFSMAESAEYRDEDARVEMMNRGELAVNVVDLVRIFGLRTPEPPPAPNPPTTVQQYAGVVRYRPAVFNTDGSIPDPDRGGHGSSAVGAKGNSPLSSFRFVQPKCDACEEKMKKGKQKLGM
jgi:Flp pilus assembly protein CpaB